MSLALLDTGRSSIPGPAVSFDSVDMLVLAKPAGWEVFDQHCDRHGMADCNVSGCAG